MGGTTTVQSQAIDLKRAVTLATDFIHWLEKENLLPGPVKNVALEGFAQNSNGDWLITLGYRLPSPFEELIAAGGPLGGVRPQRSEFYKTLTVDHETGKVTAMSPREPSRDWAIGEIDRLFLEYRQRGVFLDANLIVLLVVGIVSPAHVSSHSRTSRYGRDDFEILFRFAQGFQRIATLPNVLTEASNLLKSEAERVTLRGLIDRWDETLVASREAAALPEYEYLGLSDAAILKIVSGKYLLLTDDGPLANAARTLSTAVIHFDLLRIAAP
jgi:hypothetical protein